MVALGSGTPVKPAKVATARKSAASFAARGDGDSDGVISVAEMTAVNTRRSRGEARTIDELVSFHDVDSDGIVTAKEVEESWVMYASASRRVMQMRKRGEL